MDRRSFIKYVATGVGVIVIGGVAYVIFQSQKPQAPTETVTSATSVAETVPPKPESLIVRAWGGGWQESLDAGVSQLFTRKYGIKIEYDNTEDNVLQAKLRELIPQGKQPPVDVNWTTGTNAMREAIFGFPFPIPEKRLPNLAEAFDVARPEPLEGVTGIPFVNMYTYTYVLGYRTDLVSPPPTSWNVFWDPKWKKSVGMYDDGIGFYAPLAKLSGASIPDNMEPAWDMLRKLKPNIGLLGEDPDLTEGLKSGQAPLECTITTNAIEAKNAGAPVAWTVPDEGVDMEMDAMYVPKNLPENRTYWAIEYINTALSAEAQTVWCSRQGTPGVNKNAVPPPEWKDDPAFPTTAEKMKKMLVIPLKVRVENEKDWFAKFEEIMSG